MGARREPIDAGAMRELLAKVRPHEDFGAFFAALWLVPSRQAAGRAEGLAEVGARLAADPGPHGVVRLFAHLFRLAAVSPGALGPTLVQARAQAGANAFALELVARVEARARLAELQAAGRLGPEETDALGFCLDLIRPSQPRRADAALADRLKAVAAWMRVEEPGLWALLGPELASAFGVKP